MMRYISSSSSSLVLSFPPQQNQLGGGPRQAEEGLREAPISARTVRKDRGLTVGGGHQLERTTGRMQEEVRMGRRGHSETGRREGEEEEDGYPVDMHKQEASGKVAAAKPTQACRDPAASPLDLLGLRVEIIFQILPPPAAWFRPAFRLTPTL